MDVYRKARYPDVLYKEAIRSLRPCRNFQFLHSLTFEGKALTGGLQLMSASSSIYLVFIVSPLQNPDRHAARKSDPAWQRSV